MKKLLFIAFGFSSVLLFFSCDLEIVQAVIPTPPKAGFDLSTDLDTCPAPCIILFKDMSENANTLRWNFGDPGSELNNTSTERDPEHLYSSPGNYTISLVATGDGGQDTSTLLISIRAWQCGDPFTDVRDDRRYKTVWIDIEGGHDLAKQGKCWMAENLDFDSGGLSTCYEENQVNCNQFGRIYNELVVNNVAPSDWRVTTDQDWEDLFLIFGFSEVPTSVGILYGGNMDPFLEGGTLGLDILFGGGFSNTAFQGQPVNYEYNGIEQNTFFWADRPLSINENGARISTISGEVLASYIRCIKE